MTVVYTTESDGASEIACSGLTTSDTSCVLTISQPDNYTLTVKLTNVVGTSSESASVDGEYCFYICLI